MLKQWANSTTKNSNIEFRLFSDGDFIWFLSDCVMNVLSGVVPVNKKELKKFEKTLRQLSNRKKGKNRRIKTYSISLGHQSQSTHSITLHRVSGTKCILKSLC